MQLDVIEEGVEELGNLERFVLKTKPTKAQAAAVTVRIPICSLQQHMFLP